VWGAALTVPRPAVCCTSVQTLRETWSRAHAHGFGSRARQASIVGFAAAPGLPVPPAAVTANAGVAMAAAHILQIGRSGPHRRGLQAGGKRSCDLRAPAYEGQHPAVPGISGRAMVNFKQSWLSVRGRSAPSPEHGQSIDGETCSAGGWCAPC